MTLVLLVDDEATLRKTLAAYLEDEGMETVDAGSGEAAVELVKQGCRPDACIMDMRLPGIDGHEAILRLHELAPDLRFIVHTGSLSYGLSQDLRDIGITRDRLFLKPLMDMKALADAVRGAMNQREDPHA